MLGSHVMAVVEKMHLEVVIALIQSTFEMTKLRQEWGNKLQSHLWPVTLHNIHKCSRGTGPCLLHKFGL